MEPLRAIHRPWERSFFHLKVVLENRVVSDHGEVSHNEVSTGHQHSGCGSHCNSRNLSIWRGAGNLESINIVFR